MPIILENPKRGGIRIKPDESKMMSIRYRFKVVNPMLNIDNEFSYHGTPWEIVKNIMDELKEFGYKIENFEQTY